MVGMVEIKKAIFRIIGFSVLSCVFLYPIAPAYAAMEHSERPTCYEDHWGVNFARDVRRDFCEYFQPSSLIFLGDTMLAAGVLANTGLDRAFADHWQNDLRSSFTNNLFLVPKHVGGLSYYYAPIYLIGMGIGHLREYSFFGNVLYHWSYRSIRTFILGGLQQVFLTNALGSGRPDKLEDSKWQPFRYDTGVSGHAMYGAIPFIVAAQMTDPLVPKAALYVLSTFPGLSRINDNKHYLSQVILGWTIAFLSAQAVYKSDMDRQPTWQVMVSPCRDGAMVSARALF